MSSSAQELKMRGSQCDQLIAEIFSAFIETDKWRKLTLSKGVIFENYQLVINEQMFISRIENFIFKLNKVVKQEKSFRNNIVFIMKEGNTYHSITNLFYKIKCLDGSLILNCF